MSETYKCIRRTSCSISYALLTNYMPRAIYIRQWPYSTKHLLLLTNTWLASGCFINSFSIPSSTFMVAGRQVGLNARIVVNDNESIVQSNNLICKYIICTILMNSFMTLSIFSKKTS